MIRSEIVSGKKSTKVAAKHPAFVPGLLVARIREDVVANVPDVRRIAAAAVRAIRLPEAIEKPLQSLQAKKLIQEVVPVFAGAAALRPSPARFSALAFARSVRESENEDLRGINILRLSPKADLARIEKQLSDVRGIEYVHRVPARWLANATPAATSADPLVNRSGG